MSIECAFHGFVAADAEAKTSQAGKAWTRLRVGIGKDEDITWITVAVFGTRAIRKAQDVAREWGAYLVGQNRPKREDKSTPDRASKSTNNFYSDEIPF